MTSRNDNKKSECTILGLTYDEMSDSDGSP